MFISSMMRSSWAWRLYRAGYNTASISSFPFRHSASWWNNGYMEAMNLMRGAGGERADQVGLLRSLGADEVIDRDQRDFTTTGETYDIVFDAVGKSSFRMCRRPLVKRGKYLSTDLGFLWQNPLLWLVTSRLPTKRAYLPVPTYRKAEVELLRDLLEAGDYRPVIDRTYPLDQAVEANRYVDSQAKVGNAVLILG